MGEIGHWYFEVLRRWNDFEGRSRRREYWTFMLVNAVASLILRVLGIALIPPHSGNRAIALLALVPLLIFALILIIPALALSIRRLHDIGKSGWWFFIDIIPLIGPIVLFIFHVMDSQPGDNQYGPNPKGEEDY